MLNRPVARLLPDVPEFDVTVIPPAPSAPRHSDAVGVVLYQRSPEDFRAEVAARILQALLTAQGPNLYPEQAIPMALSYTDALLRALK